MLLVKPCNFNLKVKANQIFLFSEYEKSPWDIITETNDQNPTVLDILKREKTTKQQKINIIIFVIENEFAEFQSAFELLEMFYNFNEHIDIPKTTEEHSLVIAIIINKLRLQIDLLTRYADIHIGLTMPETVDWNEKRTLGSIEGTLKKLLQETQNFSEKQAHLLTKNQLKLIIKYEKILQEIYNEGAIGQITTI